MGGKRAPAEVFPKECQRQYFEFLDDEHEGGRYFSRTKALINGKVRRLVIDIDDLRRYNPPRAACLLSNCFGELAVFEGALKEYVAHIDPTFAKEGDEFLIGFEGNFGSNQVTPRTLGSHNIGNLICVEGIVTKCSLSNLIVSRSVHYSPTAGVFYDRVYSDLTSRDTYPSSTVYLTKDDDGNILETEFGLSDYKDHQVITIQEMPEEAPAGQLPRSVDVVCDNDLVDLCKPGDRVQVIGCYRCIPGKHGGFTNGIFRCVILANSINPLKSELYDDITREDMMKFKTIATRDDVFELLCRSLAPSIHGLEYVKKAIICLLFGGNEKVLLNGTRLRGDINVLLIGDPGVAKSQLLRCLLHTAPRAVQTTGRGSSGVGLTAAVTIDTETDERRLEAGAMVLADRGVVCIDEFDKMSDIDRTSIHEVMEQGCVNVSKAGIHARLNARCAVLAAANPVYGKYDKFKTPMENIGLQDSLLSRFDLLFVLLDIIDAEDDHRVSNHVVQMHRYRDLTEENGDVISLDSFSDSMSTASESSNCRDRDIIFEENNPLLRGGRQCDKDQILNIEFMKKYVYMGKTLKPTLSPEAAKLLSEEYTKLRMLSEDTINTNVARTQPVTTRTLETLIRLSTARAKARFSCVIDPEDARGAVELVQYAIFKKVFDKKEKKKRSRNDGNGGKGMMQEEELGNQKSKRQRNSKDDEFELIPSKEDPPLSLAELRQQSKLLREKIEAASSVVLTEKYRVFKNLLFEIFTRGPDSSLPMHKVINFINSQSESFSKEEIEACFKSLSEENHIMIADDIVFLI